MTSSINPAVEVTGVHTSKAAINANWAAAKAEIEALQGGTGFTDATLLALAALSATPGLVVQTATDVFTKRTLQAPAAGLTITNPAGTAGDPTFVLANDLAALEGLGGTGIARRTGTDAWSVGTAVNLATEVTGNLPVANLNSGSGASATSFWNGNGVWAGAVTSVALTGPAGIFAVTGSPVTTTGTLALSVAGNSGGIPYFSSASLLGSSAALTQFGVVYGGGAGGAPVGTAAGTTGQYLKATTSAAPAFASFTPETSQVFLSGSGTYTTPAGVLYLKVRLVGGGGGGAGSGTTPGAAAAGGNTTFSTLTGSGGAAGTTSVAAGGAASGGNVKNQAGGSSDTVINAANQPGGGGGNSYFSGGAGAILIVAGTGAGQAGVTNTGGGGGGASCAATNGPGSGGGAGGYVEHIITSPAATYSYAVGAGGAGGTLGTLGAAGGAGGSGIIIVEEHYQ